MPASEHNPESEVELRLLAINGWVAHAAAGRIDPTMALVAIGALLVAAMRFRALA